MGNIFLINILDEMLIINLDISISSYENTIKIIKDFNNILLNTIY